MARCNCAGNTCGCSVIGSNAIRVTGIGTAADPFVIDLNAAGVGVGALVKVDNSTTVEMTRLGTGTSIDPIVIKAAVVLRSPDSSRWTLAVSNTGALTAVKL